MTDHGCEVSSLEPSRDRERRSSVLDRLIAEELASRAMEDHRSLRGERVPAVEPVSPLVADQRR